MIIDRVIISSVVGISNNLNNLMSRSVYDGLSLHSLQSLLCSSLPYLKTYFVVLSQTLPCGKRQLPLISSEVIKSLSQIPDVIRVVQRYSSLPILNLVNSLNDQISLKVISVLRQLLIQVRQLRDHHSIVLLFFMDDLRLNQRGFTLFLLF